MDRPQLFLLGTKSDIMTMGEDMVGDGLLFSRDTCLLVMRSLPSAPSAGRLSPRGTMAPAAASFKATGDGGSRLFLRDSSSGNVASSHNLINSMTNVTRDYLEHEKLLRFFLHFIHAMEDTHERAFHVPTLVL